jgi:hypothetical protein
VPSCVRDRCTRTRYLVRCIPLLPPILSLLWLDSTANMLDFKIELAQPEDAREMARLRADVSVRCNIVMIG